MGTSLPVFAKVLIDTLRRQIARLRRMGAAKACGVNLCNPNGAAALQRGAKGNGAAVAAIRADAQKRADLSPIISDIRASGATSLPAIARELNSRGIVTPRGGASHSSSVRNLPGRL